MDTIQPTIQKSVPSTIVRRIKTLSSVNYGSKILSGLRRLQESGILCDLVLTAGGTALHVHKAVMAACSDYFCAMLTSDMVECHQDSVELHGVSSEGLKAVVHFAYAGILKLTVENIEDVLSAASHLQITEAMDLCCKYLESAITVENCIDILNLSELYTLKSTGEKAKNFILESFENLADNEQFDKLNSHQLGWLLQENSLKVESEYKLFEIILKWVNNDPQCREEHLPQLMGGIRLPLLTGEELVEKVSKIDVMQQNKHCTELLTAAKDYHIVVSKQPLLQTSRTQVRSDKPSLVMCHAENLESYNLMTKKHALLRDSIVPLYNPCVCVVNNFMYACGGKYDNNDSNEIATARCFRYDPRFDTWYELASMNEARKDFSLVALNSGNALLAIAGQDENMVMCSMEYFSISSNDWGMRSSLPHATYGHAATVCTEIIYLSGGQRFDGFSDQLFAYDSATDLWQEKTPMFTSRANHAMETVKGKIYIIGGNVEDSYFFAVPRTRIECYNPTLDQWTVCKSSLAVREAGSCVLNNRIYIAGGINGEHYYSNIVHAYNGEDDKLEIVEKFPMRIIGKACCVLILPQYV
ncbi:kelch-like protein 9 [Tubulanus polymorphus]|uniref:kelch-like protein 9 n=1 Tax=Tubulanus polymorphus TaxID=672921 RepID=UPI003DA681EA